MEFVLDGLTEEISLNILGLARSHIPITNFLDWDQK